MKSRLQDQIYKNIGYQEWSENRHKHMQSRGSSDFRVTSGKGYLVDSHHTKENSLKTTHSIYQENIQIPMP